MENEIRTSIKNVYGMLWELLALYEKTERYNEVPKGAEESDIWDFMGNRLLEVRKEIDRLFLGNEKLRTKLIQVTDETEYFIRRYEQPGVVTRWKQINPLIQYFDCSFELMEKCPEQYQEISMGLSNLKLSCYPGETVLEARNRYFAETEKKIRDGNLRYSDARVFQDELLRTLTLVFENDFKEYL